MIPLKIENIREVLQAKGYEARFQPETGQINVIFKIETKEFPLFIKIMPEITPGSGLLQMLVFMPCQLKASVFGDVARLLHLLNKEIELPGFGMDEVQGLVFYRFMVTCVKNKLEETFLDNALQTMQTICKNFFAPIEAVGYGLTSFDELLRKAQDLGSDSNQGLS